MPIDKITHNIPVSPLHAHLDSATPPFVSSVFPKKEVNSSSSFNCNPDISLIRSPLNLISGASYIFSGLRQLLQIIHINSCAIAILSFASFPIDFYYAAKEGRSRFILTYLSIKTSQIWEAMLNAGRTVNNFGSALSNLVKPLVAVYQIKSVKNRFPSFAPVITRILPIVMVVFGSISIVVESAFLRKNVKVLKNLKQKAKKRSLSDSEKILKSLQKTKLSNQDSKSKVINQKLIDSYFTTEKRYKQVARKIDWLLTKNEIDIDVDHLKDLIGSFSEIPGLSTEKKEAVDTLLSRIGNLLNSKNGFLMKLEEISSIYEELDQSLDELLKDKKVLDYLNKASYDDNLIKFFEQFEIKKEEIKTLKNELKKFKFDDEILNTVHSEIHRHITYHTIFILIAVLSIVAGALFLASPSYFVIAAIIAGVAAGIDSGYIIFDKTVSQDKFLKLERFFHILPKNEKLIQ